jgi:hypothetical protein
MEIVMDEMAEEDYAKHYASKRARKGPYRTLLEDKTPPEIKRLRERIFDRWPDLADLGNDPDLCRELLAELVDTEIERLDALLQEYKENEDEHEQKTVNRLASDHSIERQRRLDDMLKLQKAYHRTKDQQEKHTKRRDDPMRMAASPPSDDADIHSLDYVGPKLRAADPRWRGACAPEEFKTNSAARRNGWDRTVEEADESRTRGWEPKPDDERELAAERPVERSDAGASERGGEGGDWSDLETGSAAEPPPARSHPGASERGDEGGDWPDHETEVASERPAARSDRGAPERGGEGGEMPDLEPEEAGWGQLAAHPGNGAEVQNLTDEANFAEIVRTSEAETGRSLEAKIGHGRGLDNRHAGATTGDSRRVARAGSDEDQDEEDERRLFISLRNLLSTAVTLIHEPGSGAVRRDIARAAAVAAILKKAESLSALIEGDRARGP